MWQLWDWGRGRAGRSNEGAVANAREASTELSQRRVERDDVALYREQRYAGRPTSAARPVVQGRGAGSLA